MSLPVVPKRVFLPWSNGALVPQVAQYLFNEHTCFYPYGDVLGLEEQVTAPKLYVVVPGARAARILRSHLLKLAVDRNVALYPPIVLTPGALFSELFPTLSEAAPTKLMRRLAWAEVLAENHTEWAVDFALLNKESVSIRERLKLADRLEALASELGAVGVSFTDVMNELEEAGRVKEAERWQRLVDLSEKQKTLLTARGYLDIHEQRAICAEQGFNDGGEIKVLLAGVTEMPAYVYSLLENSSDCQCEALIFANSDQDGLFDAWGRPHTAEWITARLPLQNQSIHACESLYHEAEVISELVHAESLRCQQKIVIGSVGVAQHTAVKELLASAEIEAHSSEGISGGSLPSVRALKDLAALITSGSWQAFASVIRNPYLQRAMVPGVSEDALPLIVTNAIRQADNWHARALPKYAPGVSDLPESANELKALVFELDRFTKHWRNQSDRSLATWVPELASFWLKLGGIWQDAPNCEEIDAAVVSSLEQFERTEVGFAEKFSYLDVLSEFVNQLSSLAVPHGQEQLHGNDVASIDVVGWLELLHDPAQGALLTGLNEGILPEARVHDPFLPDSLKVSLCKRRPHARWTTEQRFARDVYLFASLLHSKESVHVSFSAKSEAGELLMPGRLLYRCADSELPERLHHLQQVLPRLVRTSSSQSSLTTWTIPPAAPALLCNPEVISVTDFGAYIASPYRYFLRRMLHLDMAKDSVEELDPAYFGSLIHKVLERYGWDSQLQSLHDASALTKGLHTILDEVIAKTFAVEVLPSLQVQYEVIRARLRVFAEAQLRWQAEGWQQCNDSNRIHPEFSLKRELLVDGVPVMLQGRIDRVDVNLSTNEFALLDYKTGDQAALIEKSHRSKTGEKYDGWLSLQMPLYQWMASGHPYFQDKTIVTGLIALSREGQYEIKELKNWDSELESALQCASTIVRSIRAGAFAATEEDQERPDEFSWLCGFGQQGGLISFSASGSESNNHEVEA
jgi:ATP-dependent helicase/nuclease subunit B